MRAIFAFALCFVLSIPPTSRAEEEPLANKVRKSIQDGVRFMRGIENGKGDFEHTSAIAPFRKGGVTALCVVALLNAGVPPDDPIIQRCLRYLRTVPPTQTYTVGLQTMAFCLAGHKQDRQLVERNLEWLKENRVNGGWGYDTAQRAPDHSINQYALLGIHEARQAAFELDEKMLKSMYDHYKDNKSGQWTYRNQGRPTLTMTTAGLCNLLITGQDLQRKKPLQPDGVDPTCGEYDDIPAIRNALDWIGRVYPNDINKTPIQHPFYALYGIERAGRLTGRRFFGEHDWYRVGCEYLIGIQQGNGAWKGDQGRNPFDHWESVATSFSLLFLSKGRTPVLISKLAHGNDGNGNVEPWNRKRNDVRNITDFASKELFDKQPLAWQVFDTRDIRNRKATELAEELLQSPILYLNGHSLIGIAGGRDEEMLKEFISNGGFIFAEACCNKPQFDQDFRKLMKNVTGSELAPLGLDHPVWRASGKFPIPEGERRKFGLEGIQQGCKTVVIYIPTAVSGWWENNDRESAQGKLAFHLSANVIAYATGLEKPKDRLFPVEITRETEGKKSPRGFLQVAQLVRDRDALPLAPKAIPNLMAEVNRSQLEVHQQTKLVMLTNPDVLKFRFFYMHDRNGFVSPKAEELEDLKLALETRGVFLADAACGSEQFDKSFRELCKRLFPDNPLQRIDVAAEQKAGGLFSREVNGFVIQTVRCRKKAGEGKNDLVEGPPELEGIKINGRWAVIYSKYDIGCALERHLSPDCLGHDFDSAKTLARAVVLYALRQ